MGFRVSGDYAEAAGDCIANGLTGYATMIEQEQLMKVLPSRDELRNMFIKSMHLHAKNVELMEIRRSWHKLWLTTDPDGPGYARQKVYAFLWVDHDTFHYLDDPKVADRLRADAMQCVDELAKNVALRVSTFRAYNALNNDQVVTVRAMRGTAPGYLQKRGAESFVRVSENTDQLFVIIGSYFTVAPPGEEWIPQEST